MKTSALAALMICLASLLWGASFSMVKVSVVEISPTLFLALRFAIAFAATWLLWPGWWRRITRAEWVGGLLVGGFLSWGFTLQTLGIALTSASNTAFLTGLFIVLVPFIAWVWQRERPSPWALVALLPAVGGLFLMTRPDLGRLNPGDLLCLIGALGWGMKLVAIQIHSPRGRWPTMMALSFLPVIVTALVLSAIGPTLFFHPSAWTFFFLFFCGVVATTFTFGLTFRWQPNLSSAQAGLLFTLEPVSAGVVAAIALGERIGAMGWAGAGLILGAILLSEVVAKNWVKGKG